jgi:hypothetical protein
MEQQDAEKRAALADEERRMRRLKLLVDLTTVLLRHHPLSRAEAYQAVAELRARVVNLFPDKGEVFDLIYWPRFRRLIEDRFGPRDL